MGVSLRLYNVDHARVLGDVPCHDPLSLYEVDLDEALELFQEGVKRLKNARKLLQDTELTVKKVVDAADASLPDDDVDD